MSSAPLPAPEFIRLRGVRQNNLKGFDLDLPLGRYVVVTGLSGAGKSSLVFDTLHAEGQRRYVETFSAYTRQFLDLLDKPKVDSVENIRPSIAIEQSNTVRTSRSTVGTMTELTDFAKVWFSHVAECFDPETGEKVEDDNPGTIWRKTLAAYPAATLLVCFRITKPANLTWPEILTNIKGQGYTRVLVAAATSKAESRKTKAVAEVLKIDELLAEKPSTLDRRLSTSLHVIQDRLRISTENQARFLEATETALHFGQGVMHLFTADTFAPAGHYSRGLHSPKTGRTFRPATPGLFSFNSPLGACPRCRGFGRLIDIDWRLAIPDHSVSIDDGAIKPWEGAIYGESKKDLLRFTKKLGIPTHVPFAALTPEQRDFVIDGSPGYDGETKRWPQYWYGLKGFFRWLEKTTYKMHVRVFLSRYRAYNPCPDCRGSRLQPEALCWKWRGKTLPELYQLPVSELLVLVQQSKIENQKSKIENHSADLAYESIVTRLSYLNQVGLGYLTLDRSSRTLSGGEVMRVNLTSCLGTSLVDTLFVLDEPSVGLHPRDIDRLLGIIRTLTDAGNTVVVVEHDEAMIRAADHVIEVGPEPGARGGRIVYTGSLPGLLASPASITGRYFSGRETIPLPAHRRPVACHSERPVLRSLGEGGSEESNRESRIQNRKSKHTNWLRFSKASKHNIADLSFALPLQRLVCLSGVSGSGKSTLLDNVIHQGLLAQRQQMTEDPAVIESVRSDLPLGEIVLVDQSPLSRTPRSNPALYCEAWDLIRDLFAATPAAQEAGFNAGSFSFNSGEGRCDHCQGLGSERVEMQFLSDVFVPCPVCDGRRFKPELLAVAWQGKSVADLLATTVTDALALFADHDAIRTRLASLDAVGLGYLALGQPLNTLSGGESQRLKLVRYLSGYASASDPQPSTLNSQPAPVAGALLLLDEPTTGLHRHDVKRLLSVLQQIVDRGHSVVVIEHNLDVLKSADWILEVGPEAGAAGGRIVAEGTPEALARSDTATAPFLREALNAKSVAQHAELMVAEDPAPYGSERSAFRFQPSALRILGARENNLKNISVTIPHRQLSVVTGVSGSGKSTLAFDIVFAEGQRRFMESMSPYARQFVEQLPRPDLDRLTGIPPTVAIEQRITRGSRKSTVATITEVAQYLRLLYARLGVQHHPETGRAVTPLSPGQLRALLEKTLRTPAARKAKHLYLCAPLIRGRKGHHEPIAKWIARQGYELMRADGRLLRVDTFQKLDRYKEHDVEVVICDLKAQITGRKPKVESRKPGSAALDHRPSTFDTSARALDTALRLGKGSCFLCRPDGRILSWFSTTRTDVVTGESFPELDPKHFSFNSPRGWCPACRGHGRLFPWLATHDDEDERSDEVADALRAIDPDDPTATGQVCPACHGDRLNRIARAVKLPLKPALSSRGPRSGPWRSSWIASSSSKPGTSRNDDPVSISLPQLLQLTSSDLLATLESLDLDSRGRLITRDILPQIEERLRFLDHVGLGYLSLDRPTETLSGGESQRIRLAAQLGSNLTGVLYVLDEPSIGLHARDNERLIDTLLSLRDKGNTLLVVEHDDVVMERADRIIDLGPGAGLHGGEVLANDTPANLKQNTSSLTGLFLSQGISHPLRGSYRELAPFVIARRPTKSADEAIQLDRHARLSRARDDTGPSSVLRSPFSEAPAWLALAGINYRNLRSQTLHLPLGRLTMVCGPSGAGKSTLFRDILHPAVACAIKHKKPRLTGRDFVRLAKFESDDSRPSTPSLAEARRRRIDSRLRSP